MPPSREQTPQEPVLRRVPRECLASYTPPLATESACCSPPQRAGILAHRVSLSHSCGTSVHSEPCRVSAAVNSLAMATRGRGQADCFPGGAGSVATKRPIRRGREVDTTSGLLAYKRHTVRRLPSCPPLIMTTFWEIPAPHSLRKALATGGCACGVGSAEQEQLPGPQQ